MFCPGCGRFLNNNVKECVRCGIEIDSQYKIEKYARMADGVDLDWKEITLPKEHHTDDTKTTPNTIDLSKKLCIIGSVCSIIMLIAFLMPWISWTNESTGEIISYSGLSILNISWAGTMGIMKYYPLLLAFIGAECILLFFIRCRGCADILATIFGMVSIILCMVFYISVITYTDCNISFGLPVCSIASMLIMIIGLHGVKISRNPSR
ncbi:MAG: hypothetical protein RBR05_06345 [Candidatus Methanomethylophilaceae archaeon]|nr:hypothetical protein [Candidatus Methanomethylophilaceae archaeon]MDY0224993.1 hypothetical protein [Candidatus Methanomethylophilaceae archaeon]